MQQQRCSPPGWARLKEAAAWLLLLQLPPFLFPPAGVQIIARGGAYFMCSFLGSLRWLLWCTGRWPEGSAAGLTVSQWQGLLFLPVEGTTIRAKKQTEHASYLTAAMRFGALAAVIVLLSVEEESDSFLGMLWRHSLYSKIAMLLFWGFMQMSADVFAT
mmetsp:Transcript_40764/g.104344  ORF Transcript_40764/g.104344 Transcript_40764/m.104344 type:complete len:159 (+) Transcript_40764:2-478(+)